jgi:hypothetical protein
MIGDAAEVRRLDVYEPPGLRLAVVVNVIHVMISCGRKGGDGVIDLCDEAGGAALELAEAEVAEGGDAFREDPALTRERGGLMATALRGRMRARSVCHGGWSPLG